MKENIAAQSPSTWGKACLLWLLTNLIATGVYGTLAFGASGNWRGLSRDSGMQFWGVVLVALGGMFSLPTSILAKFAYGYTLRIARRTRRVGWTLAALTGLYALGAVLGIGLTMGWRRFSPPDVLGYLVTALPYLPGGLVATLVVYRRALFRSGATPASGLRGR